LQIIYAAPFILLSLLCFGVFLAVPRFRRFALAALVAPVAFGFCAIVGYVAWVLVCNFLLKIQLRPVEGLHGVIEILLFFVTPGILGSWAAAWIVGRAVRFWKRSASRSSTN
jgi:hypothetical protein